MKTLIVYYSRTQTTKATALELARKLNADVEEIVSPELKLGFLGYMKAGHQAVAKKKVKIQPLKYDPAEYELVLVGTPVWVGTVASPIRTFLREYVESLNKVAFFCTCGGSQNKTFGEMETICGKKSLANLELKAIEVKKGNYMSKIDSFVERLAGSEKSQQHEQI